MKYPKSAYPLLLLLALGIAGCAGVKPYQKMYLNDEDMRLGARDSEGYELGVHTYREGASGANGSKTGGGCGCN